MAHSYSGWHLTQRDPVSWAVADAIDHLGSVEVPVLAVTGDHDVLDIRLIADTVAAAMENARHVVLRDVGHSPNLEDPDSFNRLGREFLAQAVT